MKKVSIILVDYNGYYDTIECINSIKNIEYDNYEIIVVENGDESSFERILKSNECKDVTVIKAKTNLGFSGGNNLGIQYALKRGTDFILLLNNDTLVESDFLTKMVASSMNGKYVVTCKIKYASDKSTIWYAGGNFSSKTSRTTAYGINEKDQEKYSKFTQVSFASGCCLLIPIGIFNHVGLLSEDYFLYCEDTDYCIRVNNSGFTIIYSPDSVIYHKVSASTQKNSDLQTYYVVRNKLYIVQKYINPVFKFLAYLYVLLETLKRVIYGEYNSTTVMVAIKDFKKGIKGKKF